MFVCFFALYADVKSISFPTNTLVSPPVSEFKLNTPVRKFYVDGISHFKQNGLLAFITNFIELL